MHASIYVYIVSLSKREKILSHIIKSIGLGEQKLWHMQKEVHNNCMCEYVVWQRSNSIQANTVS